MDETASNLQNFIAICNSVDWCGLVIYDLMITLRNAFSIFISNRDVMYLSDIKSSDHCAAIYNCCAAIYNCSAASRRNDYFVWMEQLHFSMKLLSDLGTNVDQYYWLVYNCQSN